MASFTIQEAGQHSGCYYRERCHFFNMVGKTEHSAHLRELYCEQWPARCQIFQNRKTGKPIPITLWPAGTL
jgi:hypothetical protein